jgi:nucleotide-binding universal stress UspA family protein
MTVDRVLVPLDGSPLAEIALPKAVELLSGPHATLILLRAAHATTRPGADPIDAQVAVVHEAESYLAAVAARLCGQGLTQVVRSVWYSSAAKAIIDAARLRSADLIVMSTHGRSGLQRAFRGSVAEAVLRGTRTPILLIQAGGDRQFRTAAPHAPEVARPSAIAAATASSGPSELARRR